jgi:hypothetical protein
VLTCVALQGIPGWEVFVDERHCTKLQKRDKQSS